MRVFSCPACKADLYFHNLACVCGLEVAYDPQAEQFVAAAQTCRNRDDIWCNWTADQAGGLCRSCAMTEVIPETFHKDNQALWAQTEQSKRWVLATLGRWGWFKDNDEGMRPVFHMLAEETSTGTVPVTMGHINGLVTIDVGEADPVERVRRRVLLDEPLRTMTGHFRHELAHFFFDRLSASETFLEGFREHFGDERADYGAALDAYYRDGPPADWAERCVTAYAASHPHEDWAESFAHLLHLTDIVDSFLGVQLTSPDLPHPEYNPYAERDADQLITIAAELGIALNHVNRSMGISDLYPFVLPAATRQKLRFVHAWIAGL